MTVVLDASAVIAFWLSESGEAVVREAIGAEGALISTVNMAEVLSKIVDRQRKEAHPLPSSPLPEFSGQTGIPNARMPGPGEVVIEVFTLSDAVESSKMRAATESSGLSLGDRACLALGMRRGLPVLTADRAWAQCAESVGVTVRLIR